MNNEPRWVEQIFESQIARRGGVVRRKMSSIHQYASLDAVREAAERRGYHIVQHGDQWLMLCDEADVRIIT
jgi:hypothetical protein